MIASMVVNIWLPQIALEQMTKLPHGPHGDRQLTLSKKFQAESTPLLLQHTYGTVIDGEEWLWLKNAPSQLCRLCLTLPCSGA